MTQKDDNKTNHELFRTALDNFKDNVNLVVNNKWMTDSELDQIEGSVSRLRAINETNGDKKSLRKKLSAAFWIMPIPFVACALFLLAAAVFSQDFSRSIAMLLGGVSVLIITAVVILFIGRQIVNVLNHNEDL